MRRMHWLPVTTLVGSLVAFPASAQTAREGGSANAQLMQQIQQLGSERTALQAENTRMKKEIADLMKERDSLRASRATLERSVQSNASLAARSDQGREDAEREVERQKERMQELVAKFRETAQTLRDVETEKATFQQSLVARDAEIATCRQRNEAFYKLNGEILARLENDGVFARVARTEPFTKLKRVELENLVDEYRYQAEGLTDRPSKPSAAGAIEAGAASSATR
jgi:chromosome segregation ATPase